MDKFLKKVHRVIIFNQNIWLKSYINMNRSKKKAKNDIEDFFKLMSNEVFGKKLKNERKHIRCQTCHNKKKELFSVRAKFSYYKVFNRKFISNRNKKTEILRLSKAFNTRIK